MKSRLRRGPLANERQAREGQAMPDARIWFVVRNEARLRAEAELREQQLQDEL